jgi:hypothetical protein
LKKLVATSYAMAVVVVSSLFMQIPIWMFFCGFSYFAPIYITEVAMSMPFLFNMYSLMSASMVDTVPAHLMSIFAIAFGLTIVASASWIIGQIFKFWLMRRDPWFKSVI